MTLSQSKYSAPDVGNPPREQGEGLVIGFRCSMTLAIASASGSGCAAPYSEAAIHPIAPNPPTSRT